MNEINYKKVLLERLESVKILNGRIEQSIINATNENAITKQVTIYLNYFKQLQLLKDFCINKNFQFDFFDYFRNIDDLNDAKLDKIKFDVNSLETNRRKLKGKKTIAKRKHNTPIKNQNRLDKIQDKSSSVIFTKKSIKTISAGLPESGKKRP
ncbi:MAG: hypothetical protein JSR12_01950 [Bacteroidetes bacterium]|nr:hypothetical protein [Bacteroidota bacterium]